MPCFTCFLLFFDRQDPVPFIAIDPLGRTVLLLEIADRALRAMLLAHDKPERPVSAQMFDALIEQRVHGAFADPDRRLLR